MSPSSNEGDILCELGQGINQKNTAFFHKLCYNAGTNLQQTRYLSANILSASTLKPRFESIYHSRTGAYER